MAAPVHHRKPRSEDLTWTALTRKGRERGPERESLWAQRDLPTVRPASVFRLVLHLKLVFSLALILVPIVHSGLGTALGWLGMGFSGPTSWAVAMILSAPVIKPLYGWASRIFNP